MYLVLTMMEQRFRYAHTRLAQKIIKATVCECETVSASAKSQNTAEILPDIHTPSHGCCNCARSLKSDEKSTIVVV